MLKFLGLAGALKALLFQGAWGLAGLAGIAAGLALLIGDAGLIEKVPFAGRWLAKARQALGAVLIGAGGVALGVVGGFAHRGALEQAAILRMEKEQIERVVAQKNADLKSAREISDVWSKGLVDAQDRSTTAEAAILAYQQKIADEEARNAQDKTPDRCRVPDRIPRDDAKFLCGLAGRWAPGGCRAPR